MKKLIINADDFGLTNGCNEGILQAIKNGIVTSTTVMMNMSMSVKGLDYLKKINFKSVGIHLTLTVGKPTLSTKDVPSLVDFEGNFYRRRKKLFPKMNLKDVEKELRNQIELFLETGIKPSHLDSHHHIHMYDGIREVVCKLSKEYDLPLRCANEETKEFLIKNNIATTDHFSMEFYDKRATIQDLKKIIDNFDDGSIEIMTHPAILDNELSKISSYNLQRERELEILTNKEIIKWIEKNNVKLVGYHELRG